MVRTYILLCSVFFTVHLIGQDMLQDGYDFLDSQQFEEASIFFSDVLVNDSQNKTARICYARATGLGGDAIGALDMFKQLMDEYPGDTEIRLNIAEAELWNSNYEEAKVIYAELLEEDSQNFVSNYGYANCHAALFENDIALEYINRAIKIDPTNKSAVNSKNHIILSKAYILYKNGRYTNALQWLDTLAVLDPLNAKTQEIRNLVKSETSASIVARYENARDLGGNHSESKGIHFKFNMTDRHTFNFDLSNKLLSTENTEGEATQNAFFVSDKFHINSKFRLTLGGGMSSANVVSDITTVFTYKAILDTYWNSKFFTQISYNNQVSNYSKDLLSENIVLQDVSFAFNYNVSNWLGIYNNGIYTIQSDLNKRSLIFSSLYFTFLKKPLLRIGVNHNYMIYQNNVEAYFSPAVYQAYEGFFLIDNAEGKSRVKYKLLGAIGHQRIDKKEVQITNRLEASFGFVFSAGVRLMARYQFNNTAQATASGAYSFHQWTLTMGYDIVQK